MKVPSVAHVLITGGAGFIGSNLAEHLASRYNITILDDLSTGKVENIAQLNVNFIRGSILDKEILYNLIPQVDAVVHLAAQVSVIVSMQNPVLSREININGFCNVLEACKQYNKKLVYASSAAVYGESTKLPLSEDDIPSPISNYGLEKYINEQYATLYKMNAIGLRFFNVYGKKQDPSSPYSGVISKFIQAFLEGGTVNIFGDGMQSRDFIFVKDVCRAIEKAIQHNNTLPAVYNVCTNKNTTLLELVQTLEGVFNKTAHVKFHSPRNGDIIHSLGSNDMLRSTIGFQAETCLFDGLRTML